MTRVKLLFSVLFVALVAGLTPGCGGCSPNYSEGSRVGVVTKVSTKGVFFKSTEAELKIALGADTAGVAVPESFLFNVAAEAKTAIEAAMRSGKRVEVVYRQWWVAPTSIDHTHVVYSVRPVQ